MKKMLQSAMSEHLSHRAVNAGQQCNNVVHPVTLCSQAHGAEKAAAAGTPLRW